MTIADYVADRRAATPSNAAEIAGPDIAETASFLAESCLRLDQAVGKKLDMLSRRLRELSERPALTDPEVYLGMKRMGLDHMTSALCAAGEKTAGAARRRYGETAAKLDALSPLKVLGRGYAIAEKDGAPVRDAADVDIGDRLDIRLAGGSLGCVVEDVRHGGKDL